MNTMNATTAQRPRAMIGFAVLALAVSLLVGCGGGGSASGASGGRRCL